MSVLTRSHNARRGDEARELAKGRQMKVCSSCGIAKDLDQFWFNKNWASISRGADRAIPPAANGIAKRMPPGFASKTESGSAATRIGSGRITYGGEHAIRDWLRSLLLRGEQPTLST